MKILTVDIGTGTQDILLLDTRLDIENAYKLVLPSPTMLVYRQLQKATSHQRTVLLSGVTMGGGPSQWAVEAHLRAGLKVFATPQAALTFNDDLNTVIEMGIQVVSEDEAARLPSDILRIQFQDFDFPLLRKTFEDFSVDLADLAAVSVAVFDHGAAPVNVSDRQFRFDYLDERIRGANRFSAFAYRAENIPPIMTRLQAVAQSAAAIPAPLVVMDTAPAAVLGATFDPQVSARSRVIIANVGNFHTLAFRLGSAGIEGVFEHHTGLLDLAGLEGLLLSLADSTLKHADVFDHHGHGALIYTQQPLDIATQPGSLVVTGPRRSMLRSSKLAPYFAAPFGDMMISGCFGLLAATADLLPDLYEPITQALLAKTGIGRPPWEI